MITNMISIIDELKAERDFGNDMTKQFVERIDSHIRDLELMKAWAIDSGRARAMAIDGLLGNSKPAEPPEETGQAEGVYGPDGWTTTGDGPVIDGPDRLP